MIVPISINNEKTAKLTEKRRIIAFASPPEFATTDITLAQQNEDCGKDTALPIA